MKEEKKKKNRNQSVAFKEEKGYEKKGDIKRALD